MKRLSGSSFTSVGVRPRYRGGPQNANDQLKDGQFEKELRLESSVTHLKLAGIGVFCAGVILTAVLRIVSLYQSITGN